MAIIPTRSVIRKPDGNTYSVVSGDSWFIEDVVNNREDGKEVNSIDLQKGQQKFTLDAEITGLEKGDIVYLSGSNVYDGYYAVEKVDSTAVTFSASDFEVASLLTSTAKTVSYDSNKPKLAKVKFCEKCTTLTKIDLGEITKEAIDVTTLNDMSKVEVPVSISYGDGSISYRRTVEGKDYERSLEEAFQHNLPVVIKAVDPHGKHEVGICYVQALKGYGQEINKIKENEATLKVTRHYFFKPAE